MDTSFYVLTVDLWSADGSREVNLVRHSATSPSISAATSSSYPPPPQTPPPPYGYQQAQPPYQNSYGQIPNHHNSYGPTSAMLGGYYSGPTPGGYYANQMPHGGPPPSAPSGMFTRNLIGSLSASAFKLTDPNNKIGVWFILQDLSVRTEGNFRYARPCLLYERC